jgi:hypothetical protein
MGFFTIILLAIVIAASTFGLNQVMLMSQDIKYIRSVLTSQLDQVIKPNDTGVVDGPIAPVATTDRQPEEQPPTQLATHTPSGAPIAKTILKSIANDAGAWVENATAAAASSATAATNHFFSS